jgi:hypothetical protein
LTKKMTRDAIPAEIRRDVLCEAGHRCAIPTCRYPDIDVHHIIPWEVRQSHDFENLIALCPNCHRRADAGEIDRKSLRWYKSQLSAAMGTASQSSKSPQRPAGRISEVRVGNPGYEFEFEFPVFEEPELQIVGTELEVWGHSMLHSHRRDHALGEPVTHEIMGGPNTTEGAFEVTRHDPMVISLKYRLNRYGCGAAHSIGRTVTRTYLQHPLYRLELTDLFAPRSSHLEFVSRYCRTELLRDGDKDEVWVNRGTEPDDKHFRAFNVTVSGLLLTFDEYQVDCFGAGPQVVQIPYEAFKTIVNPRLPRLWWPKAI